MELSNDEQTLLIAGIGYLVAVGIWALSLHVRARTMLGLLGETVEPTLWQFIRSGEYRRQLDNSSVALIDDYRRRTKFMLIVSAGAGILLLIRFWPLLKPEFL